MHNFVYIYLAYKVTSSSTFVLKFLIFHLNFSQPTTKKN